MSGRPELRVDFCSAAAARYACETWHYSGTYPVAKSVRIGVWEGGDFKGAVVFTVGSGDACTGVAYGLGPFQMAELQRVAFRSHATPVSRILAIATRILQKRCPGLRLLVSFADPSEGHHGGIYQAGGWVYVGVSASVRESLLADGRWVHARTIGKQWGVKSKAGRTHVVESRIRQGKHRYLFPLDPTIADRIRAMAKPYPKRAGSAAGGTPVVHTGGGGSTPTPALL